MNLDLDLLASAITGDFKRVKLLLSDVRVDPATCGNWAICLASENGHLEIVKLLLSDPRVDPLAYDNQALRWASENGHLEIVKLLLADSRVSIPLKLTKIGCTVAQLEELLDD